MLLGGLDRVEADGEAECVGLTGEATDGVVGVSAGEVVAAEVVVVVLGGEHLPDRGQDRVLECDDRFLLAQPGCEALVAGSEVGAFSGPGGGHRGGAQGSAEPPVAMAVRPDLRRPPASAMIT